MSIEERFNALRDERNRNAGVSPSLRVALAWAIAEIGGKTRYDSDEQRENALEATKASLAAAPEAEARLRERVAELTFDLKVARTYGDEQSIRAHRNLERAEAAEARLAQAEGGPAVTEALRKLTQTANSVALEFVYHLPGGHQIWDDLKAARAALHPQSAAGEEGK